MFTEQIEYGSVNVSAVGMVSYEKKTRIYRDGTEIAAPNEMIILYPGMNIDSQPDHVRRLAQAAWTDEVIAAYAASIQRGGDDPA